MKTITKLFIMILLFIGICVWYPGNTAKAYSDHVLYDIPLGTVGFSSGSQSNSWDFGAKIISPELKNGLKHITYMRFRVKLTGNASSIGAEITLCGGSHGTSPTGNNKGAITLTELSTDSGSIERNTWYTFERTFTGNQSVGNNMLCVSVGGGEYRTFLCEIYIEEVRYREHTFDVFVSATENKYVDIQLTRDLSLDNTRLKIVNVSDGNRVVADTYGLSGNSFTFTDTQVSPEQTYTYQAYGMLGRYEGRGTYPDNYYGELVYIGQATIKVPSDATLAMEAAQQAKIASEETRNYVWDPEEEKSVAVLAKEARDKAVEAISKISVLETAMQSTVATDLQLFWDNQKTATLNSGEWLNIGFGGNGYQCRYSVNNGAFSTWNDLSNRIFIDLGAQTGYKNIAVQVGREGQAIITKYIGIWKL